MIKYALKCANNHEFESWFHTSHAYSKLQDLGQIACPICGSQQVEKTLMAPALATSDALTQLRHEIESTSEYVGEDFAQEARKIHHGDAVARAIYGEASYAETKQLLEDGVPVAPLPFLPTKKTH